MKYYSTKKVTEILGVTAQTLRNWDKEGKLKPSYVKSNGYRYYSEESILSYTQERKTKKNLNVVGYARVSSKKQSDDLERQIKRNHNQIIKALEKDDKETIRLKMIETEELLNKLTELEKKDKYFENMELREEKGV